MSFVVNVINKSMHKLKTIFLVLYLGSLRQPLRASPTPGYVVEFRWRTTADAPALAGLVVSNSVAISAGRLQCLALKSDGTVVQWNPNCFRGPDPFANTFLTTGQGGSGNRLEIKNTMRVMTNGVVNVNGQILSNIAAIAVGDGFGIGLRQDRTVVGWGENAAPIGPGDVVAIAAASFSVGAVESSGAVIQWTGIGWPRESQFNEVPGLTNVIAIAMGGASSRTRNLALKNDGSVARWGSQSVYDDETPPIGLSSVVAIAAGSGHSLALKTDGTVVGWGFNDVGQATGVVSTTFPYISSGIVTIQGEVLSNVVAIAANHGYSMALKKDGAIVTWGRMRNNLYPVDMPSSLSNVVAIAAGENYCLAITTNSIVAEKFSNNGLSR